MGSEERNPTTHVGLELFRKNWIQDDHKTHETAVAICLVAGILIIPINILVFKYFGNKDRSTNNQIRWMFRCLSGTDALVGGVALIQATVRLLIRYRLPKIYKPSVEFSLVAAYFTSNVAFRMSIFLNVLIAVVRTIYIVWPLRARAKIKLGNLRTCALAYLAVNIIFFAVDMCYIYQTNDTHKYQRFIVDRIAPMLFNLPFGSGISRYIVKISHTDSPESYEVYHNAIFISIGYAIPAFIVLFTLPFLVKSILRPTCGMTEDWQMRLKTTGTICLISVTFFVCNVSFLAHVLYQELYYNDRLKKEQNTKAVDVIHQYKLFFSEKVTAYLTSLINPIILIARSDNMIPYFLSLLPFKRRVGYIWMALADKPPATTETGVLIKSSPC